MRIFLVGTMKPIIQTIFFLPYLLFIDAPLNRWDSIIIKYCEKNVDYQIFFTEEELAEFES